MSLTIAEEGIISLCMNCACQEDVEFVQVKGRGASACKFVSSNEEDLCLVHPHGYFACVQVKRSDCYPNVIKISCQ